MDADGRRGKYPSDAFEDAPEFVAGSNNVPVILVGTCNWHTCSLGRRYGQSGRSRRIFSLDGAAEGTLHIYTYRPAVHRENNKIAA